MAMDLGLFRRRKSIFWLWIIAPPLLTITVHFCAYFYCKHIDDQVSYEQALAQYLPKLESALNQSQKTIKPFCVFSGSASEAQSALNSRISQVSTTCGLVVNSLTINSKSTDTPIQKLEASVEGDGKLLEIMKFIKALQSPTSLISLTRAKLTIRELYPTPIYHWSFEFKTGFVPVTMGAEH